MKAVRTIAAYALLTLPWALLAYCIAPEFFTQSTQSEVSQ